MKILVVNENIRLKEIGYEDVKPIFKIIDSERNYLREWLPFVDETKDVNYTQEFVNQYIESESGGLTFTIFFKNQLVGLVGMKDNDFDNKKTEIGYWLSESFQNKGIVTESCRTFISYIFDEMDLNRIQLKAATGNIKSQQVAERLNFIREGVERDGELHARGFVDLVVFGMLKPDWNMHKKQL